VVLQKGAKAPVMGYLVSQDASKVVIRLPVGDAQREAEIPRSEIDELIITVVPERLAELDPSEPPLYREYAEELAEKRRDPEARDAAIRLYLMAATLGNEKLRKSSLLGLIALARSPEEERRFRAAAYLHDPEHDASLLVNPRAAATVGPANSPTALEVLEAVRLARQAKPLAAKVIAERPSVKAELAGPLASLLTHEELLAACTSRPLTDEQLGRLLKAEAALDPKLAGISELAETSAGDGGNWSQAAEEAGLAAVRALDLEALTEFDPQASLFRDGKWVRP
jgi:hypothetical protein